MIRASITAAFLLLGSCQTTTVSNPLQGRYLAHDVFLDLIDESPEACEALAQDCREALGSIPSVLGLDAGLRMEGGDREINDQSFDVVLHVLFADEAGLAEYIEHPDHLAFVDRMLPNVKTVRVFDAWVEAPAR